MQQNVANRIKTKPSRKTKTLILIDWANYGPSSQPILSSTDFEYSPFGANTQVSWNPWNIQDLKAWIIAIVRCNKLSKINRISIKLFAVLFMKGDIICEYTAELLSMRFNLLYAPSISHLIYCNFFTQKLNKKKVQF